MSAAIVIETVASRPLAAVAVRIAPGEIGARFRASLDKVYAFLAARNEVRFPGAHNVFVYHRGGAPGDGRIGIEYGVQVVGPFACGDVIATATPAGRIAKADHVGPYARLGETHDAVRRWCRANGHALAGIDWEIYGDWNDDPAKLVTTICYLLA